MLDLKLLHSEITLSISCLLASCAPAISDQDDHANVALKKCTVRKLLQALRLAINCTCGLFNVQLFPMIGTPGDWLEPK